MVSPAFISEWGAWAVFLSVLVTQLGAPVPAAPMLLLAGSQVAAGFVSFGSVFAAAVAGVLISDGLWFTLGRRYGRHLLTRLVRVSLSLDSSIRRTHAWFERYGAPLLLVAKFVPGLGLVASPLLGSTKIDRRIFFSWDLAGGAMWSGAWLAGGTLFGSQLNRMMLAVSAHGITVAETLLAVVAVFLAYRWIQRLRFRRWLAHIRITPQQLDAMMRSEHPPVILDARPHAVRQAEPHRIPGAMLIDLASPGKVDEALLEHDLVVYCVCPNEATAKTISQQMRRKGFRHIRALKGGLDAWELHGYPVEPLSMAAGAGPQGYGDARKDDDKGEVTVRAIAPD
ncbi:cytochrome P460 [Cupriavidus sp. USMAHM13]|uniref:Cytochrome P460 n=1 Tax=Cupriavidus malaysiensis TaxID=367825 RepID=A0ABN4TFS3_9BURK|nr:MULTISPECIES: VTT domain-containing protein [Cupriavidus]AOY99390.1 cytochrome P460 [Cupriavidus sp. USMAHM13]AOZ06007.1 cytochrome P460 [Cupriavidus malaysiensis]